MPCEFSELDLRLWESVTKLYLGDPLTHAYLLYDLVYGLDRTDGLVDRIPCDGDAIVVVHDGGLLERVTKFLKPKGQLEVKEHLDMVVDEEEFKPYPAERAVRLDVGDECHVVGFLELARVGAGTTGCLRRAGVHCLFHDPNLCSGQQTGVICHGYKAFKALAIHF